MNNFEMSDTVEVYKGFLIEGRIGKFYAVREDCHHAYIQHDGTIATNCMNGWFKKLDDVKCAIDLFKSGGWRRIKSLDELPPEFIVSHNGGEVDFGYVNDDKILDKNGMELDYEYWRPIDFPEPPDEV